MMALHAEMISAGAALLPITQSTEAEAGAARARPIAAPRREARSEALDICAEERVRMPKHSVTSGFHHCRGGQRSGSNGG
jgi:hypothetical protein